MVVWIRVKLVLIDAWLTSSFSDLCFLGDEILELCLIVVVTDLTPDNLHVAEALCLLHLLV